MPLQQVITDAHAKIVAEIQKDEAAMNRLIAKYDALSPEDIAAPEQFLQATKDRADIEAQVKQSAAAAAAAKELSALLDTFVRSLSGNAKTLSHMLIKLNAVDKAAKAAKAAMAKNVSRATITKMRAEEVSGRFRSITPNPINSALGTLGPNTPEFKTLSVFAKTMNDEWDKLNKDVAQAEICASKLLRTLAAETPK